MLKKYGKQMLKLAERMIRKINSNCQVGMLHHGFLEECDAKTVPF